MKSKILFKCEKSNKGSLNSSISNLGTDFYLNKNYYSKEEEIEINKILKKWLSL